MNKTSFGAFLLFVGNFILLVMTMAAVIDGDTLFLAFAAELVLLGLTFLHVGMLTEASKRE